MSANVPPEPLDIDLSAYFATEPPSGPSRSALLGEPSYLEAALPPDLFVTAVEPPRSSHMASAASDAGSAAPSTGMPLTLSPQTVPGAANKKKVPEPDLPEPGAIIDKYRIEELVGIGGFAAVYRATHLLLHTPVAVKLLRPKVLRRRPELAPLLCDEARFAARIDHPNVVRVFDVTHTPHITYVVIEFVDGGSLADAISKTGRMSVGRMLRIGIDVTLGLAAGLKQGLIHRDIKPANILLTRSGQAKIADLGLAQMQKDVSGTAVASVLDSKGMVGTPGYMAPEQAVDSRKVDFRADIYALGVTLYHAALGEPPFPLKDRERSIELHRSAAVPRPSERVPGFPTMVERILLQMLAKSPHDRQSSYGALLEQLQQASADFPT